MRTHVVFTVAILVQSRLSRDRIRVDLLLTCVLHVHVLENDESLCEIRRDNVNCVKYTCNDWNCNLLVTALIIRFLLIVSGNVDLNPGPMKKCLKCE